MQNNGGVVVVVAEWSGEKRQQECCVIKSTVKGKGIFYKIVARPAMTRGLNNITCHNIEIKMKIAKIRMLK